MSYRHNNFDSLRFWAAMAVVWSHSVPITEGSERREPLFWISGGQTTTGTLAVTCFFVISGYLITRSFDRADSPWSFVLARALRIMPALAVVLLLGAFVVGPLVSSLPVAEYLSSGEVYRYVVSQLTFVRWYDELPGVFTSLPKSSPNGSLWTLRFEVECYALVFLLGVSGLLKRHVTLVLFLAAMILLVLRPGELGTLDDLPSPNKHLDLATKFLAGALIYQWKIQLNGRVAALCALVSGACLLFGQYALAERSLLAYVVLYLCIGISMVRMPTMTKWGDLSYGIYIYAWPVSQLIVFYTDTPHWYVVGALATPIVLLLALASWHGVEKVALSYKKKRGSTPAPKPSVSLAVHE